jgi:uncharacterized C2H2 Zn-finger protein
VSDAPKRQASLACPRCERIMREVTRMPPTRSGDGLIAYECPACSYVKSEIWPAQKSGSTGSEA